MRVSVGAGIGRKSEARKAIAPVRCNPEQMNRLDLSSHLRDPARLDALRAVALLDTPAESSFDRLTRLGAKILSAPISLVSLVDSDRQFFKSCVGLPDGLRETPLSHSFCQHNRIVDQPLVVEDARTHPVLATNGAVTDFKVVAYLGFPLITSGGYVIGSYCVIDRKPRRWQPDDIDAVRDLTQFVVTEIQLRAERVGRHRAESERDEVNHLYERLQEEYEARVSAEQEQEELAAQLNVSQTLEAIGRLAGGVAHDLNNLLTPILGYSEELLLDTAAGSASREPVEEIRNAGMRARDLVKQLLAIGRKQNFDRKPIDLNKTIGGVLDLFRRTIPEDIEIRIRLADDVVSIDADLGQIERMLVNLAVNAAEAMPEGGTLTVETVCDVDEPTSNSDEGVDGRMVGLNVSDTGRGMDAETRRRLFEPFYSTKGEMGTGLGLATVFGVVKQHSGSIRVESAPGRGSTFYLTFPAAEAIGAQSLGSAVTPEARVLGDETILLAEDNTAVRELARAVLEKRGYRVITAENGAEALDLLSRYEGSVDLLLTDVVMPGINGRELYDRVAERFPKLKVVYISGYPDSVALRRGALEQVESLIPKPFSTDSLVRTIQRMLSQSSE